MNWYLKLLDKIKLYYWIVKTFISLKRAVDKNAKKNDENFLKLCDVKVSEFRKGSKTIFYKKRHTDSEFLSFDFLRPKYDLSMPETRQSNRGVNDTKKQKILTDLVSKMPAVKHIFWENLPTSKDSSDLLSNHN